MVAIARQEEIQFLQSLGVWQDSTGEECRERTGRAPVSTRWEDVDNGRCCVTELSSRLVARGLKTKDGPEFEVFAIMPPPRG